MVGKIERNRFLIPGRHLMISLCEFTLSNVILQYTRVRVIGSAVFHCSRNVRFLLRLQGFQYFTFSDSYDSKTICSQEIYDKKQKKSGGKYKSKRLGRDE